jgi:GNAT superfamily N-acetyltransferase
VVRIREARDADSPEVVRVIKAVYDEYGFPWYPEGYHADLYALERSYAAEGNLFLVAEIDGRMVGTAALERFSRLPEGAPRRVAGADCSVERLYVHPEGRRQGVGSALMERIVAEARARGCGRMEIWTDKRFEDAHRLYGRLGAVAAGERLCDDPEESPEWGMAIDL